MKIGAIKRSSFPDVVCLCVDAEDVARINLDAEGVPAQKKMDVLCGPNGPLPFNSSHLRHNRPQRSTRSDANFRARITAQHRTVLDERDVQVQTGGGQSGRATRDPTTDDDNIKIDLPTMASWETLATRAARRSSPGPLDLAASHRDPS